MELLVVLGEGDEAPGQDADEAGNEMVWMAHEPLLAALDRVLGGFVATDVPTIAKGQESVDCSGHTFEPERPSRT